MYNKNVVDKNHTTNKRPQAFDSHVPYMTLDLVRIIVNSTLLSLTGY